MSLRWLRILAFGLLIPAFSIFSQAQSLGEVARQVRAEQQQSRVHAKVITNDDIASAPAAPPRDPFTAKSGDSSVQADTSADGTHKAHNSETGSDQAASSKNGDKAPDSPEKQREAREAEIQKRIEQINKQYLDRIAAIREKLGNAQKDIARLQRDQVESTIEFQRSVGSSPSVVEYERQQRLFNEQIEAQHTLIVSLNSQLGDAQESARHAGVPHVYD
jgi:hypothetical protein